MARKGICPRCGGSIWKYIRNGEYTSRCGNCGWEPGEEEKPEPTKKKLKWEPIGDFLKEEEPAPAEEITEPEEVEDTPLPLDVPAPEELLAPEDAPAEDNEEVVEPEAPDTSPEEVPVEGEPEEVVEEVPVETPAEEDDEPETPTE